MKKIYFFILIIFFFANINSYSQDGIFDKNSMDYNWANTLRIDRLLDSGEPFFPCSCNCDSMVKSADIFQNQSDDELYLYGGWANVNNPNLICQRIELNIKACNSQSIPSISILFPPSSDDCFSHYFYLYRDDSGDGTNTTLTSSFDPKTSSGLMEFNPPIPPCSSRKVIFYICSESMRDCEHDSYDVQISVNGQNPPCEKEMTWHFDFITGQQLYKIDINLNDIKQNEFIEFPDNSKFQIIDIYQNTIFSGVIKLPYDIENIKNNKFISKGLYLLIIKHDNNILYKEKFIKGF